MTCPNLTCSCLRSSQWPQPMPTLVKSVVWAALLAEVPHLNPNDPAHEHALRAAYIKVTAQLTGIHGVSRCGLCLSLRQLAEFVAEAEQTAVTAPALAA
ncbi:MAG: hypothetical protein GC129_06090 [Proteobacteria bacterium]|nr:hypothetical protein [Pseudomonadota bacterium]